MNLKDWEGSSRALIVDLHMYFPGGPEINHEYQSVTAKMVLSVDGKLFRREGATVSNKSAASIFSCNMHLPRSCSYLALVYFDEKTRVAIARGTVQV